MVVTRPAAAGAAATAKDDNAGQVAEHLPRIIFGPARPLYLAPVMTSAALLNCF